MQKVKVKIKLLHPEAKIPTYGSLQSAGFDIYAIKDEVIGPGKTIIVGAGISLEPPEGLCYQFWDRSGLGARGIHHFAGLIDSDYRGEVKVVLFNSTQEPYIIKKGDRIIQAVLIPMIQADFEQVNEISGTQRGSGGFHSTGK